MSAETLFTVLPFSHSERGDLMPGEAKAYHSAETAVREADQLASEFVGVVAFSRTIDVDAGVCQPARVIKIAGQVPTLAYLR